MTLYGDIIFTPRLRLRRITRDDIPVIVGWSNSETAHGDYLSPERLSEETGLIQLTSGVFWTDKTKTFIIELQDGAPIGTIHYWLRPERKDCAVISVKISVPGERGKGYGTEAQKYLIIKLFERMSIDEVEMYTDINNRAQQRCLNKLGFELIESLSYNDQQVYRLGHLFRLEATRFEQHPVYQYHYE